MNPDITLEQGLANLASGGLTGSALTGAQNALRGYYANRQQPRFNPQTGQRIGGGNYGAVNTSVSANEIGSARPYNLPTPPPQTASAGLDGYLSGLQVDPATFQATQTTNALAPEPADLEATNQSLGKRLLDALMNRQGEQSLTADAYSGGVDPAKKELDDIQNQIRAKQLAARREVEAIQKNTGGMNTQAGSAAFINEANRKNTSELADLSVIEQAKLQNYDTAKSIADRKVAAQLEQQSQALETLKFAYTENKEQLTKAQDRRFQVMLSERERLLKKEETQLKTVNDLAIEAAKNGAPTSVTQKMLQAKTVEEALRIGGTSLSKQVASGSVLSNLPTSVQTKIISSAESFGGTDVVKKFNATVDGINLVNGISADTTNPSDHQTIVYAFAKSLDPESVVREGEYATIKKYAQSAINKYSKEITNALNGTGFLSKEAIENIKTTMQNNYKSRKPAYDNLYRQKSKVINNIAGSDVADLFLVDYAGGVGQQQGPANGQTQVYNGATYKVVNGYWVKQ